MKDFGAAEYLQQALDWYYLFSEKQRFVFHSSGKRHLHFREIWLHLYRYLDLTDYRVACAGGWNEGVEWASSCRQGNLDLIMNVKKLAWQVKKSASLSLAALVFHLQGIFKHREQSKLCSLEWYNPMMVQYYHPSTWMTNGRFLLIEGQKLGWIDTGQASWTSFQNSTLGLTWSQHLLRARPAIELAQIWEVPSKIMWWLERYYFPMSPGWPGSWLIPMCWTLCQWPCITNH